MHEWASSTLYKLFPSSFHCAAVFAMLCLLPGLPNTNGGALHDDTHQNVSS
jgi:hypothetical protein